MHKVNQYHLWLLLTVEPSIAHTHTSDDAIRTPGQTQTLDDAIRNNQLRERL